MTMAERLIGMVIFPKLTQLDMTGPYEVFIKFPDSKVHLIWKTLEAVRVGGGMEIMPTVTFVRMQVSENRLQPADDLALQCDVHAKHPMGRGMLRSHRHFE